MNRRILGIACLGLMAVASLVLAIAPGDDLLVAGATRSPRWHSDLYINNAGATTVSVDVLWLERDQPNPNPDSRTFSIGPDETLILDDVLLNDFGMNSAAGGFRITVTGGEVTANLLVFSGFDNPVDGTIGSGFEAIPASAATGAGESTTLMGLVSTTAFYTNIFALAGADGVTMDLDLLDPDGNVLDTARITLEAYEPWLSFRTDVWDVSAYDNGTLLARVSAGSAVILGSKIDENSADPTTLESAFGAGAGSADGTYQFAIYDSLAFASGGNLVIDDDIVEAINGTYVNFDKVDDGGVPECTLIFSWGIGLTPTAVEDFESGVEFPDSYPDDPDTPNVDESGDVTWTVVFSIDDNLGFSGTVDAVGANFSDVDTGCNGTFPTELFEGGKSN
jgi:hypothetical protein